MARSDFVALIAEPATEYIAANELRRFGLSPYLPELKKRYVLPHGGALPRRYPLFPRYILLPIGEANHCAVRIVRGVRRFRAVLADDIGRPWRCPVAVIDAIKLAESCGEFDEIITIGDQVKLTRGVLASVAARINRDSGGSRVELLLPLFSGCRATVAVSQLMRA